MFTTPVAPAPGVRSASWWHRLRYVEALSVGDESQAIASGAYGAFNRAILPAVRQTVAAGGGALNFAVEVEDIEAAVAAMQAAGIQARTAVVSLGRGPLKLSMTIGWLVDGPPWRPFVIHYGLPRGCAPRPFCGITFTAGPPSDHQRTALRSQPADLGRVLWSGAGSQFWLHPVAFGGRFRSEFGPTS